MTGPRHLNELLEPSGSALAPLVQGARQQQHLDRALRAFLDSPLCDHVSVAQARDGILVLAADAPVWGHRVRYLTPALLEHMRKHRPDLSQVRVIVRPPQPAPAPSEASDAPSRGIPATAGDSLSQAAEACHNPELARVLRRLAQRAR